MILVGISGKIKTGKTTLANALVDRCAASRKAYGDFLKEEVAEALRVPLRVFYTQSGKAGRVVPSGSDRFHPWGLRFPDGATYGEVLQWWGTEYRRAQDPDYWCHRMEAFLEDHRDVRIVLAVDDVRFPNEARVVRRLGGVLVRLDPYPGWTPSATRDPNHLSETALDDWTDWDLRSDGSPEEVFLEVRRLLERRSCPQTV